VAFDDQPVIPGLGLEVEEEAAREHENMLEPAPRGGRMRGRKPIPTVLKVLRGNPGQRRLNPNEPTPEPLEEATPPELTAPAAAAEWARTIVPAIRRGQVTSADRAIAIAFCPHWAHWLAESEEADRAPIVVLVGEHGHPVPNPARGMANRTYALLRTTAAELGLTPSSRSRVHTVIPATPAANKWEGLLG
jgi:P27 family predicted phage terminase small subunit